LLVLFAVVIVLVDRILRQRAILQIRKRIAADLHDELGADLHAIGLMSDLARAASSTPEKLDGFLLRLRALTERAGTAARHCTNMIEAKGLYEDLVQEMRRTSARIMADLEHEIEF
jgi:signal transduction histidine kinase